MSSHVFAHYPSHRSEGRKLIHLGLVRLSGLAHFGVVLLILIAALVGSSFTIRRQTTGSLATAQGNSSPTERRTAIAPALSPASPYSARQASPGPGTIRGHLYKDLAAIVVCFFAASLWWLARSPSERPRLRSDGPGNSRPLVLLLSPWNGDEQDRKQISRDLHDSVGQVLTAANLELASLRSSSLATEQVRHRLDNVSQLNAEALRLVRDLAMGLRPAMLDDVGLAAALDWQVRQFSRRAGILASIDFSGEIASLPESHRTCIYRCVQEALTNCARHSRAKRVEVELIASHDAAMLAIEDDGVGLPSESAASPGLGILGMHERVEALGGRVSIGPGRDGGTRLHFEIPVPVEAHA